jgi:hypothetical protein
MRSPVSKEGIGESKAIKSQQSSHGELTFPSMLEAEFVKIEAYVLGASADLEERIRWRAFELYTQRGRGAGHVLDDWLQAEEEIVRGASRHWAWRHDNEKTPKPKRWVKLPLSRLENEAEASTPWASFSPLKAPVDVSLSKWARIPSTPNTFQGLLRELGVWRSLALQFQDLRHRPSVRGVPKWLDKHGREKRPSKQLKRQSERQ